LRRHREQARSHSGIRNARSLDIDPTEPPKALHPGASRINGCFKPQKQLPIAPYALISEQSAKVSAL
jgi:hypothetical protein